MSIPKLTILLAALAAAAYSLQADAGQGVQSVKAEQIQPIRRLTNQEKLQRIRRIPTGVNQSPQSILDSFTLTVNDPVIKGKAALSFRYFAYVCPRTGFIGYAKSIDDNFGIPNGVPKPYVSLEFNVSQPNKVHVATFYFYCFNWLPAEFYVDNKLVQETRCEGGAVQAMVAFKPTKKGKVKLDLKGDAGFPVRINFTALDMDVLQ